MLINVIHDRMRTDRKVLLDSEVREHNLDIQLWPAIIDPVRPYHGINLAHKQIVRWARDRKLPMVCIAEDDFHLTDKGAWESFIGGIPQDFDMYLSAKYCGKINPDRTIVDFCGLHLYIVHERFYDCFLGVSDDNNIDRGLANRGRYIVADPICAIQYDGWSDNKRRYASYGYLLADQKMCCTP